MPLTSAAGALGNSASPVDKSNIVPQPAGLLLRRRRYVTSATCLPCRMIELVFEELARLKGRGKAEGLEGQLQVALVKVDLGVWMGSVVARECGVTATLTFGFFFGWEEGGCGVSVSTFLYG